MKKVKYTIEKNMVFENIIDTESGVIVNFNKLYHGRNEEECREWIKQHKEGKMNFKEHLLFELYKDLPIDNTQAFDNLIKKANLMSDDIKISTIFRNICNYQIKTYGEQLRRGKLEKMVVSNGK